MSSLTILYPVLPYYKDHFKPGNILDWKLNPSLEPVPMHDPNEIKEEKLNTKAKQTIPAAKKEETWSNLALNVNKTYSKQIQELINSSQAKTLKETLDKKNKQKILTYSGKLGKNVAQSSVRTYKYSLNSKSEIICTSVNTSKISKSVNIVPQGSGVGFKT